MLPPPKKGDYTSLRYLKSECPKEVHGVSGHPLSPVSPTNTPVYPTVKPCIGNPLRPPNFEPGGHYMSLHSCRE